MEKGLSKFTPKYSRLVCVDSDGCAIDSMEIKHRECFGPLIVREWALEDKKDEFLKRWNDINLYSATRGVNRFKGLAAILKEFEVSGWQELEEWTRRTPALSNDTLKGESPLVLKKALNWSLEVNEAIGKLPLPKPFNGVKEALTILDGKADIAVVSAANAAAIANEWDESGLLQHVSVVLSQNDGSKSECIAALIRKGYQNKNIMMLGDSPGDWQAATENGVYFYPVIPGDEEKSWEYLSESVLREFCVGRLDSESLRISLEIYRSRLNL